MNEREICISYREAKNPYAQLQVLADLNGIERKDVVKILLKNGETVQKREIKVLNRWSDRLQKKIQKMEEEYSDLVKKHSYKRLEVLDGQIREAEREYYEIEAMLTVSDVKSGRSKDGNNIRSKHMQILR